MLIRRERPADVAAVQKVHELAAAESAGTSAELVQDLRTGGDWIDRLSLVAVVAGEVVGHVALVRARVGEPARPVLGLVPLSVLPGHQGRGIATALVHAALAAAEALDEPVVGVVGEVDFYRHFGFMQAHRLGIDAPRPEWQEEFQLRALNASRGELLETFRPDRAARAEATRSASA